MKLSLYGIHVGAWLVGLFILLATDAAYAQNCPVGSFLEGGQDAGAYVCAPVDHESPPKGHWLNQWGAIATDIPKGAVGASYDQPDEERAKMAAINNCLSNGGSTCKIEITYGNSCVAMLQGDNGYTAARAPSIDGAIKVGMKSCTDAGFTNCIARYTSCSKAKWVQ